MTRGNDCRRVAGCIIGMHNAYVTGPVILRVDIQDMATSSDSDQVTGTASAFSYTRRPSVKFLADRPHTLVWGTLRGHMISGSSMLS